MVQIDCCCSGPGTQDTGRVIGASTMAAPIDSSEDSPRSTRPGYRIHAPATMPWSATLDGLADGTELRPGEALAAFGVQWVVFSGEIPLSEAMTAQLDLRPLPLLVYQVFESEVSRGIEP